jgi:hypothetical protein
LASALQFARYTRTVQMADALLFGILAALAILTRGSAWALALVPGLTILLTRRFDLLRRVSLWLSALPVLVTCVPWYVMTAGGVTTSWGGSSGAAPYWMTAAPFYAWAIRQAFGRGVTGVALLGVWGALIRPWPSRAVDPVWAALFALLGATLIVHCVTPTGLDVRFAVAALPEVALFAAYGIAWLAGGLDGMWPSRGWRAGLSLAVLAVFLAGTFTIPRAALRFTGFAASARLLVTRPAETSPAFLVVSDENGEGAVIAEAALDRRSSNSFALRGTKLLVREDWIGRGTEDRFPSHDELDRLLNQIPVSGILLDTSIPPNRRQPFQERIRDLVTANPEIWERIASASIDRQGEIFADAVQVYLRRPVSGSPPQAVDQDLLGRLIFENSNR